MKPDFEHTISHLKHCVSKMVQEQEAGKILSAKGSIWPVVLDTVDYVGNLSVDNFRKIRMHTEVMTGESVYYYWHKYPAIDPEKFASESGYQQLTEEVPEKYWIGEPANPDIRIPLGVSYKGKTINRNIVRYQSCLSNLYHLKMLERINQSSEKQLLLEIGGGYGGLAHQLGHVMGQKVTYIVLDLAPMLLFSGGYLAASNPDKKIYVYEKETFTAEFLKQQIFSYDFVLLPHYVLEKLYQGPDIAVMLNMMSFQEMPKSVIESYLKFGQVKVSGCIYSNNMNRMPYNADLAVNVTEQLNSYFRLFPSLETYQDPSVYSEHPWFYRFFAGVSREKNVSLPAGASIKFRAFVPQAEMSQSGFPRQDWRQVYY